MYKGLRKQNGYKDKLPKEGQEGRIIIRLTMKKVIFLLKQGLKWLIKRHHHL